MCSGILFKSIVFLWLIFLVNNAAAHDTIYIKVLFLYGSKPARAYKNFEQKWFGGKHGGHVGIAFAPDQVIDFVPNGKFHWFESSTEKHSQFVMHTQQTFWEIFGGRAEEMKKATVIIPVSRLQKQKLDSVVKAYISNVPYDYAFAGMRCAAAAYDILSQIKVVEPLGYHKTYRKIFYPKVLRKHLYKIAQENNWTVIRQPGSCKRKWEKD